MTYVHSNTIPQTREEALEAIANQDVIRWGEDEREPSRRLYAHESLGLLLNTLASRAELDDAPERYGLRQAADAALTADDLHTLRQGG